MRFDESRECLVCEFCHGIHFPEPNDDGIRVTDAATSQLCPVCGKPLMHATLEHQSFAYCSHCRGLLIGMERFVDLAHALRARRSGPAELPRRADLSAVSRQLNCPQCGARMHTHPYGGPGNVVIDNCPDCRVNWLDYRELQRIASAPDEGTRYDL
jgi:Zn-finger nucleic acid-binding protein